MSTPALSWLDLLIFVRVVQKEPSSALATELHGPAWTIEAQLLAEAVDALNMANWQRAGRRHAPRPKRLPRPWEKPKTTTLGADPIPISKFNDWWDSKRAKRQARTRKGTKKPPTS